MANNSLLFLILASLLLSGFFTKTSSAFSIEEATIDDLQLAFKQNQLTSRQLVEFYLKRIRRLNPLLRGVIEVNPDALFLADKADRERRVNTPGSTGGLHGIPILLKDNIATKDKLNTTAGSYALLGSVVPRDAGVVMKLRKAGAIILGKSSLSEWANFRTNGAPSGFCGRSGQGKNPYVLSASPCGSSSGSGISVAANLAAVSLGTETDGSILCPSSYNSIVGIKPTVGLTSRAGVIPISPRQDTVGPMCRTVSDAVYVLDAIVGIDSNDAATREAAKYIPNGGYRQFLNPLGLKGKRLGILRTPFYNSAGNDKGSRRHQTFEHHFQTLRRQGAVLVDNLQISDVDTITAGQNGELLAMLLEFKPALNEYLEQLVASPVRSLAAVIAFNKKFSRLEKTKEYGQERFEKAEFLSRNITNIDATLKKLVSTFSKLSKNGLEKLIKKNKLDALVAPDFSGVLTFVLAIGQYPGISVPAGYDSDGVPFGISFGGPKGSEPKLIEIAYGFETATKNPYVLPADPCGSSSGSAILVAANFVAVSLGTETDGSILCPTNANSVVGIKPTVGLTSRAGFIPISPRQDTIGPICRTVSDAVIVLDAIVGVDCNDGATREAKKYIPHGDYKQFLKPYGLKGKRLGIVRNPFLGFASKAESQAFEYHLQTLRQGSSVIVDHLEIANINAILNSTGSGEAIALLAEFKISLNTYLKDLVASPVRTLADVISFNQKFADLEKINEFGQDIFLLAQATNGIGKIEKAALKNLKKLTRDGFQKLMRYYKLDALVTPGAGFAPVLAIGGFPGINVPAGYDDKGVPFGINFGGLKGTEPKLIQIAFGFEQATKIRKPPTFKA